MTFVSLAYLVFFATVCLVYLRLPHRGQNWLLLAASYFFYGYWDWRFLGLILLSSAVDYVCGLGLSQDGAPDRRRKGLVALSVATNLAILGSFKYFRFFVDSAQAVLGDLPLPWGLDTLEIILPVGISFYTFQSMSYTIDVYRGHVEPCRRVDDFLLYVAFFPQLVAGPIERAHHLLPQVRQPRTVDGDALSSGAQLALVGFFKKMVVADNLAPFVSNVFSDPSADATAVLLATWAFAFQIYGDFSGYTDIARGCARMLGFDVCRNFRTPYLATNPSDFWLRWHISLSSWLRDYLYIPLGGSRHGRLSTWRNLLLTMLLGGLWHGANWTFVLWGAYHGLLLAVFHAFVSRQDARRVAHEVRRGGRFALKVVGHFHLVCLGWLIFRADSVTHLGSLLGRLASPALPDWQSLAWIALLVLPLLVLDLHRYRSGDPEPWRSWRTGWQAAFVLSLFYAVVCLGSPHAVSFIYFQF